MSVFFFFFFFFKELRNFLFGKLEEGQVCIYGLVIIIPYFGLVGGGGGEEVLFRVYVTIKFTLSPVTSL